MPKRWRTRKTSSLSRYLVFRTCNVKNQNDQERQKWSITSWFEDNVAEHISTTSQINFRRSFFLGIFLKVFAFFVHARLILWG
jgi:hypothetical protein